MVDGIGSFNSSYNNLGYMIVLKVIIKNSTNDVIASGVFKYVPYSLKRLPREEIPKERPATVSGKALNNIFVLFINFPRLFAVILYIS